MDLAGMLVGPERIRSVERIEGRKEILRGE
jgi:hypothetical protein